MNVPLLNPNHHLPSSTYKLNKQVLRNCTVIGQVNSQFIVLYWKSSEDNVDNGKPFTYVGLVDQHAAAERVLLEQYFQKFCLRDALSKLFSVELEEPMKICFQLPFRNNMYEDVCAQYGFKFLKISSSEVTILSVPRLLVESGDRSNSHEGLDPSFVRSVLQNLTEHHEINQNLCLATLPESLLKIFHSMACKKSVRFGDDLSKEQCQKIIEELSACQLPLQCAHGRPTIVPLARILQNKCSR